MRLRAITVVVTALVVLGLAMELKAKGRTSEAIKKFEGWKEGTIKENSPPLNIDGLKGDFPKLDMG